MPKTNKEVTIITRKRINGELVELKSLPLELQVDIANRMNYTALSSIQNVEVVSTQTA